MKTLLQVVGAKADVFTAVKVYAVEIAGTLVFVVFIVVESIKAIKRLIESIQ